MEFKISYDENGKPYHVSTDDGFVQCSRPFNSETDGWMETQLDYRDFPIIQAGRQMEMLVAEVNALRRELFSYKQEEEARFQIRSMKEGFIIRGSE